MLIKYVSAMRFTELKAKGSHSTKWADYTWHRNINGERYLIETDRAGRKTEIKQRPERENEWRYDSDWMKELQSPPKRMS